MKYNPHREKVVGAEQNCHKAPGTARDSSPWICNNKNTPR